MTAAVVVRDEAGQVTAGNATLNPHGYNQFTAPRLRSVVRLDLAVEASLQERHQCAQGYASKVMDALSDPLGEKRIADAAIAAFAQALAEKLSAAGYLTPDIETVLHAASSAAIGRLKRVGQTSNLELLKFAFSSGPIEQVLGAAAIGEPIEPEPEEYDVTPFDELASEFGSVFPAGAELAEGDA